MQLGPCIRMRLLWTSCRSSASCAVEKPAVLTIAVRTPLLSSRRTASATPAAGTEARATSTPSGSASIEGTTTRPAISFASACTGITVPAKP